MSATEELVCWRCGAGLADLSLPLRRLDECPECTAELHVCKLCEFYDTSVAKSCREPVAEEVRDKERANFCDYFRPLAGAFVPVSAALADAESQLNALFGNDSETPASDPQAALDSLFKKDKE